MNGRTRQTGISRERETREHRPRASYQLAPPRVEPREPVRSDFSESKFYGGLLPGLLRHPTLGQRVEYTPNAYRTQRPLRPVTNAQPISGYADIRDLNSSYYPAGGGGAGDATTETLTAGASGGNLWLVALAVGGLFLLSRRGRM
jgi:hypothetical protein